MLNFTQNLSRIERLTHQVTLDVEAENYHAAAQHLNDISIYFAAARIQLGQFMLAQTRSKPFDTEDGQ